MQLQCMNKKCLHEWNYKGKATDDKDLVTCPKCHYRSMLRKAKGEKSTHSRDSNSDSLTPNIEEKKPLTQSPYRKVIKAPQTDFEYPEMKGQHLPKYPKRKVRVIKDNSIVREIKNNQSIRIIPRDPLAVLKKNDPAFQ